MGVSEKKERSTRQREARREGGTPWLVMWKAPWWRQAYTRESRSRLTEFISAMAAGWNLQLIVETWSQGGLIATRVGLAVAKSHTCERHACVVSNKQARLKYAEDGARWA
ncbi:hypothetical protein JHK82_043422 [Glycine max]|nr:hypothetical protein JHK82_043422 [Glycine max]